MSSIMTDEKLIQWRTKAFDLVLALDNNGCACFRSLSPRGEQPVVYPGLLSEHSDLPITSIRFVGDGSATSKTAKSLIGTYASDRLKYLSHECYSRGTHEELVIRSHDPVTAAVVTNHFLVYTDIPVLQAFIEVQNPSNTDLIITQLSSCTFGGLTRSSKHWYHDYTLLTATNGWFREAQWQEQSLSELGIDRCGILELDQGHLASQATYGLSNTGSFSTGSHLPMGLLKRKDNAESWFWQIEHNGSWRWEIGDFRDSVYLAAGGPNSVDHACKMILSPGQSFKSVPVAFGRVTGGIDEAFGALTRYRRAIRRPHPDNDHLPIIFNDYMNCLMGDPDEDKVKALLGPVARSGAEYFVIDAGWYADDGDWWDDVGLWQPSKKRFPSGFQQLLNSIQDVGLIPGLWVEPEVVGIRSPVAKTLPEEAFFHELGRRIVERGRYQLDYRHPKVIEWMNAVIDRLVGYGAGYFKFDYNIEVVTGTDTNTRSSGAAHLDHQRAYLSWVSSLLDRYPDLVIENCSSGGQRMEYAMLSVHPLQSTSDQQDPLLYAPISAAVPTAVTPEQSASWAYPQSEWDDELNAFTVVNSLMGRVHLSGRLDRISSHHFDLIHEGMRVYKTIRNNLKDSLPIWPLGLPKWNDDWICLGMVSGCGITYLAISRRGGSTRTQIPLSVLGNRCDVKLTLLYPSNFRAEYTWQPDTASIAISLPDTPCARLFEVQVIA